MTRDNVTEAAGAPLLMDAGVAEDDAVKARIAEAAVPLDEIRNKVVAEAAEAIDGGKPICRSAECPMGIADCRGDAGACQGAGHR